MDRVNPTVLNDVYHAISEYKKQQELEWGGTNMLANTVAVAMTMFGILFFTCVCIGMKASKKTPNTNPVTDVKKKS